MADGIEVGNVIRIFEAPDTKAITRNATQGGKVLSVENVTASTITLSGSDVLLSEVLREVRVASVIEDPLATVDYTLDLNFAHHENSGDVITRSSGSWIDDGFRVGMRFSISGSSNNDSVASGFYTIASINDTEITLSLGAELTSSDDSSVTLSRSVTINKIFVDQRDDVDIFSQQGAVSAIANNSGAFNEASIFLGSSSGLKIDKIESSGVVRVKAQGDLSNANANQTDVNIIGENVVLEAGSGAIGGLGSAIITDVEVGTAITARATGDIHLIEVSGDIEIGTLFSQQGGINLSANQGSIIDGLNHDFANISAKSSLILVASNGIGSSSNPLELDMQPNMQVSLIFPQALAISW